MMMWGCGGECGCGGGGGGPAGLEKSTFLG
jgi:hypothetical protein